MEQDEPLSLSGMSPDGTITYIMSFNQETVEDTVRPTDISTGEITGIHTGPNAQIVPDLAPLLIPQSGRSEDTQRWSCAR